MKLISWQVTAIVFIGFFLGSVSAAAHPLSWNRPIHYVDLIVTFVLFPSLIVCLSLSERCKKTLLYFVGILMFTYLIAWEGMHMMMHKSFFDDVLFMSIVEFIVFATIALAVNHLKSKVVRAPKQVK